MNENIDLTKILEGCPEGTEFYNTVYGIVKFICIDLSNESNPIKVRTTDDLDYFTFSLTKDGKLNHYHYGECTLFPSKEQRDWAEFERFWDEPKVEEPTVEMFDENTLKPFDKVLVRDFLSDEWMGDFFEKILENDIHYNVACVTCRWAQCIPYNEETKHLLGTREDCPEYYKWWEVKQEKIVQNFLNKLKLYEE